MKYVWSIIGSPITQYDVNKYTLRYQTPKPRQLLITEDYIVEDEFVLDAEIAQSLRVLIELIEVS